METIIVNKKQARLFIFGIVSIICCAIMLVVLNIGLKKKLNVGKTCIQQASLLRQIIHKTNYALLKEQFLMMEIIQPESEKELEKTYIKHLEIAYSIKQLNIDFNNEINMLCEEPQGDISLDSLKIVYNGFLKYYENNLKCDIDSNYFLITQLIRTQQTAKKNNSLVNYKNNADLPKRIQFIDYRFDTSCDSLNFLFVRAAELATIFIDNEIKRTESVSQKITLLFLIIIVLLIFLLSLFAYKIWKLLSVINTKNLKLTEEINRRINVEKELKNSNELLLALFENCPVPLVLYNAEGIEIIGCNNKYLQLIGFDSKDEVVGKTMKELNLLPNLEQEKALRNKLNEAKQIRNDELLIFNKQGQDKIVSITSNPIQLSDKQNLLVSLVDITAQKDTETQLILLSTALNSAANAIVISDGAGKINWANLAFSKLTGYTLDEVIGKNPRLLKSGKQDDAFYQNMWQTILAGEIWHGELINKRKDDSQYQEEMTITPLVDDNGNIIRFIAIKQDVTERKLQEKELVEAKESAEDANRMKSEFLANMSHEIRTPLNAIVGFSSILKDKVAGQKVYTEYLDNITQSSKVLLSLINDILDLAKVEAGRMVIDYQPVNILSIFNEVRAVFEMKAIEKGIVIKTQIAGDIPVSLMTDEKYLRQILFNLIGNAVKFTHAGSVEINLNIITKGLVGSKVDLKFSIKDSGVGIPKDQLTAVFEPFIQVSRKDRNIYGGTGLGLSITKRLVELLGGTITAESENCAGSVFSVSLFDVEIATLRCDENEGRNKLNFSNIRFYCPVILIAEDILSNRQVVKGYLEPFNVKIIESENGEECINCARKNKPDLILMDIQMPVMDGFTAIEILKSDDTLKDIPIIALTASGMNQQKENIEKVANDFLMKPIYKYELIEKLIKYLPYQEINSENEENEKIVSIAEVEIENEILSVEIKEELAIKFLPLINNLLETLNIDQTIRLIKELEKFNKTHQLKIIGQYCENLSDYIATFNMDKIFVTLKKLVGIIS